MATIEQMRDILNDPSGASEVLSDAQYQTVIDIEDNVYRALATSARMLASFYATKINITAGPVKVENTQKFEHYNELGKRYDNRAREGGGNTDGVGSGGASAPIVTGTSISEMDSVREDEDRFGSVFERGMNDNPPSLHDKDCYYGEY